MCVEECNMTRCFSKSDGLRNIYSIRSRVGISGTTAKSRKHKCVPSSHPGPFAVVASSRKSQTKVGTLACLSFLYQNELTM